MLEARTYRHFGHSRTDPAKYRPEEEVRSWLARDPLTLCRAQLNELGVDDEALSQVDQRVSRSVNDAIEGAKAAPDADPADALTDVWADGGAAWRT